MLWAPAWCFHDVADGLASPRMNTRTARWAAERAARDLITDSAALVRELGVRTTGRTRLDADITTAHDRGRRLVAAAAGWSSTDRTALRLTRAATSSTRRGRMGTTRTPTAGTAVFEAHPADPPTADRRVGVRTAHDDDRPS